jgi:hypothetical protein
MSRLLVSSTSHVRYGRVVDLDQYGGAHDGEKETGDEERI